MTTTGSLKRTGAGNPHHWQVRDPTGSLNRTGTGQKFCAGEIRCLSGHKGTGRPVQLGEATSITGSGRSILCNQFLVALQLSTCPSSQTKVGSKKEAGGGGGGGGGVGGGG